MIAEFNDHCRECYNGIAKGDEVHFADRIITCLDCGPASPDTSRGSSAGFEDAPGYVRVLKKQIDDLEKKLDKSLMTLVTRLDRMHAWALDLSNQLGIKPPKLE